LRPTFVFVFLELDHLATTQALYTFFNSGDYVEFEANFFGNNAHKIAYMWLLTQTICGKMWKNVGDDLYLNIVKCGRQFAQH